jgi:hypothetical protein
MHAETSLSTSTSLDDYKYDNLKKRKYEELEENVGPVNQRTSKGQKVFISIFCFFFSLLIIFYFLFIYQKVLESIGNAFSQLPFHLEQDDIPHPTRKALSNDCKNYQSYKDKKSKGRRKKDFACRSLFSSAGIKSFSPISAVPMKYGEQ